MFTKSSFAKNSVLLTRRFSRCLPRQSETAMSRVHRNMRQVAKVICDNVNKRVMPCFSAENMRQFTQCTNRTLQYMSYIQKASQKPPKPTEDAFDGEADSAPSSGSASKEQVPAVLPGRSGGSRRPADELTSSVAKKGPVEDEEFGLVSASSSDDKKARSSLSSSLFRAKRQSDSSDSTELSEYEHTCCMMHLNSDCFLSKVLHHCADSSQLRTVRLLQTMFNFVVRDVVDVVCGRIESLEQCKKYSESLDEDDLGF